MRWWHFLHSMSQRKGTPGKSLCNYQRRCLHMQFHDPNMTIWEGQWGQQHFFSATDSTRQSEECAVLQSRLTEWLSDRISVKTQCNMDNCLQVYISPQSISNKAVQSSTHHKNTNRSQNTRIIEAFCRAPSFKMLINVPFIMAEKLLNRTNPVHSDQLCCRSSVLSNFNKTVYSFHGRRDSVL